MRTFKLAEYVEVSASKTRRWYSRVGLVRNIPEAMPQENRYLILISGGILPRVVPLIRKTSK